MPTELILIRHGQSHANVNPVVAGIRGDRGLTDTGRRQAELLRDRLRAEGLTADVLYASTLRRAQETARYVAEAIELPIKDDDGLQELRVGQADGMSNKDWSARWPELGDSLWANPFQEFAPGGESWATFLARVGAALTTLVRQHPDQRVVAVTHGGVINATFALAFGLGPTAPPVRIDPENTSINRWHYDPDPGEPRWSLRDFNDAGHLR
ncbi:histidine phosphatase family protein [Microlunatus sp. Gsoil 973]|jgi:probable phosphoglycerate mutase|uniref:histidine phosphatase family protein n=1 Tax=Microlunatus sp. Gsoil 973 TaxID=2672569 RepID=UPI0012B4D6E6|nr:histidine phosphatase family protein [Microlunatus sp. Gsoil 973]QGN31700.1 histidine phosphatase family protein [Microlunatus sp. Gsoil 973]